MKKFLTFLALACLTVVGAWAQQITDLADITAGKQVYIKRNDGAYYINIANSSATTATLQSTPSLITLVDAGDGSFYFYNEDTRLYVGITGTDATTAPSASSTDNAGKFTFMTSYGTNTAPDGVFYIHIENGQRGGGNTDFLNKNNGSPNSIMTWSLSGNSYCQWVVSVPEMIDVVVNGAPSGTEVSILGETYTDGGKIPAGTTITASDVTPADITGYKHFISIVGNSVIVNYVADPDLTDLYVHSVGAKASTMTPGQWYILTQTRDYESPAMDNGLGNVISRSTTKLSDLDLPVNTPAANIAQYLVRFVASGVGNTYNIQFGTGRFFANKDNNAPANGVSAVSSETNAYNFLVATAGTSGFDLGATNDGTTRSGFGMDNSNTTSNPPHYLNFWKSNAGGGNNTWYLYPVELGEYLNTATVTYEYYYNGTLKATKTSTQEIGETVAAPASIGIFTANEYNPETVVSGGNTITVTVKDATPFVAAASYDEIEHWYAMQIRENNWLYNTGTSPVTGTSTYEASAKYAWGFVGNIFDGYVIYNKEAGDAVALDSNTPCTISAAGTSVIWTIPRVGTLGDASFGLKTEGQDPINWQNNTLKRWGGFDLGSSFRVEELYLGEQEYNVIITGAPEGTKITCDGSQYANGETLTADLKETPVSASTIDGYFTPTVEVKGLDINVTYKKYPFEIADSFANIEHWYALTVHSNQTHYLYTDEGALAFNAEGYDETDAYAWGFVGNNTDGYTIYNKATGSSVALDNNEPAAVSTDGVNIGWLVSTSSETSDKGKNGFTIYLDSNSADNKYLNYNAGNAGLYHWKNRDAGSTFTPTEINPVPEGLPVVIGDTGYATFYDEDNRIIPTGVKAYYCTQGEEGVLNTVQITNLSYIPRWTGVILEGTPGTYYLEEIPTIMADEEETDKIMDDNVLNGTLDDMSVEDLRAELGDYLVYVLSKVDGRLGFYKFAGDTLAGRKAFYVNANALVSGFILDFGMETVGVSTVVNATNLKADYDLTGRKVVKSGPHGIFLQKGRKLIR